MYGKSGWDKPFKDYTTWHIRSSTVTFLKKYRYIFPLNLKVQNKNDCNLIHYGFVPFDLI